MLAIPAHSNEKHCTHLVVDAVLIALWGNSPVYGNDVFCHTLFPSLMTLYHLPKKKNENIHDRNRSVK